MNNEILDFYVKTKKDWDKHAAVRVSNKSYDLKLNDIDSNDDLNWHLPSYSAILKHDGLKSLSDDQKRFVMGTQLLEFVEKTTIFEVEHVNNVANSLALGKYNFEIPNILKVDAFKIYTDEGFHALFSKKMADDIKKYYKIEDDITPYLKNFFLELNNIGSEFGKKYSYLSNLSSTIVSESMIVQDISNEMKGIVYEPIREMFKDHMIDEAYHANYFGTLLKVIWPQFSEKEKEIMSFNLCESILLLSKPRVDIYHYSLSKLGFDKKRISEIISDVYDNKETKENILKKKSSQVLKLLENSGVFNFTFAKEKFKASELI
ncbi:MAG: hypothetical protein CBE48_001120 [Flavobacteriales bacterium TMED288]|nr:MAG: hypothetical protein CBE48_001120 [Flavobacteriales bacterium TMED288]|tara:strand:+ start:86 stop:1042 length:957 start_codon:yes stop_codon:yes gene_type:complete